MHVLDNDPRELDRDFGMFPLGIVHAWTSFTKNPSAIVLNVGDVADAADVPSNGSLPFMPCPFTGSICFVL